MNRKKKKKKKKNQTNSEYGHFLRSELSRVIEGPFAIILYVLLTRSFIIFSM